MSYAILALLVIFVFLIFGFALRKWIRTQPMLATMAGMVLLTAIFDNLIIWAGIVAYDPEKISGIKIGIAPIEDFSYTVVAVILVPTIFNLLAKGLKK
jgi:lycopene cyclase domain-containing protein